ncbi:MqnA/MqnD/SBP family protein [Campylobacter corcagiensis]|uniref:Chorismate dehydratase n=1 Tax=Campylobacter corcagiensis TaxID=1448857 RepID=A0A7M1LKI5_9BACT|nr:MqnA/MqnD/SBP family protein [Campylobacter corcagiensis]QKF65379.1 6-amino-6-deoxyfutalosine synthase [Campylobacter corcagiensis]QOQ88045.1 menaquinone via futalosine step 1 [Campylobacter corcagiensis]
MIFGKIDYLNLLPFHVFLKKYPLPSAVKKSIDYKKDVPSVLCKKLAKRSVDAAVISSIESRRKKYTKLNMGIVAKKEVISVLVRKNSPKKLDPASMASNMLSKVLGLNGEVIIGDNALRAYLKEGGEESFYDMGRIWHEKTNLPFVFAVFCLTDSKSSYERLTKSFLKKKIKIPQYILERYAKSRGIKKSEILWYLNYISYQIQAKEKKALKLYLKKSRALNFNPN